jgi:hypothetical protein
MIEENTRNFDLLGNLPEISVSNRVSHYHEVDDSESAGEGI